MSKKLKYLTCTDCGWVFYGITLKQALKEIDQFNSMYFKLSADKQKSYYGGTPSSIENYSSCHCSNHYSNFKDSLPDELPNGSTISPILHYNEYISPTSAEDQALAQRLEDYVKNTFKGVKEPIRGIKGIIGGIKGWLRTKLL